MKHSRSAYRRALLDLQRIQSKFYKPPKRKKINRIVERIIVRNGLRSTSQHGYFRLFAICALLDKEKLFRYWRKPPAVRTQIIGFPDYEISNEGVIYRRTIGEHTYPGKILKTTKNNRGYLRVGLQKDSRRYLCYVHELVAANFIGPKPKGMQVNHRDGIKSHNCDSNLEYKTPKGNVHHAFATGLNTNAGGNCSWSKLTSNDVRIIRKLRRSGITLLQIAGKFNVSPGHIQRIVSGVAWKGESPMAKVKVREHSWTMSSPAPKKHSVRYDAVDKDEPLASAYFTRKGMQKKLGIKNLDDIEEIDVTVKVRVRVKEE